MRYLTYLLASFIMQLVAWIITPLLPMFAVQRFGAWNNASEQRYGYRLPDWLSWFQTPDNALDGDYNWLKEHYPVTYWSMVGWLNPGFQRIRMGKYWQWHLVKTFGRVTINFNFGWLLNDGDQSRALFMFSPRVRIK